MNPQTAPRLLGFRTGARTWAMPLDLVRKVMACPPVVPVPGSRHHVAGVALIQGLALPVYELPSGDAQGPPQTVGGLALPGEADRRLIVCAWGEALLGLVGRDVDLLPDGAEGVLDPAAGVTVLDPARLFASLGVPEDPTGNVMEGHGEKDPAGR